MAQQAESPPRFFGQFLVSRRIITREQLDGATALQARSNVRLGELLVSMGRVTEDQRDKVLTVQRQRDIHFGEALVEMKLLTPDEVNDALKKQHESRIKIGEALVQTGALTTALLEQHLEEFQHSQSGTAPLSDLHRLDSSDLLETSIELVQRLALRVAAMNLKLVDAWSGGSERSGPGVRCVRIALSGKLTGQLAISGTLQSCARLASGWIGEPVAPGDSALVSDGLAEFLSVISSNLCDHPRVQRWTLERGQAHHDPIPEPPGAQLVTALLVGADEELSVTLLVTQREVG
jgi:hypothetical protein